MLIELESLCKYVENKPKMTWKFISDLEDRMFDNVVNSKVHLLVFWCFQLHLTLWKELAQVLSCDLNYLCFVQCVSRLTVDAGTSMFTAHLAVNSYYSHILTA